MDFTTEFLPPPRFVSPPRIDARYTFLSSNEKLLRIRNLNYALPFLLDRSTKKSRKSESLNFKILKRDAYRSNSPKSILNKIALFLFHNETRLTP